MKVNFKLNDAEMQKALRRYASVRNMRASEVVKKRALNVAVKLMLSYRRLAPSREEIESKAMSLGYGIKVRPSIARGKGSRSSKVKRELTRRKRSIRFTSMGWVVAGRKAGLGLKAKVLKKFRNKVRGFGRSKLKGLNPSVVMINAQDGAAAIEKNHKIIPRIMKREVKDMTRFIERKTLAAHKKKSGF